MRSLGFAAPRQPRQNHYRLNACRRRLVRELNSTSRRFGQLARRGPAGRSTRSGGAFRLDFWPGAARRRQAAAQDAVRSSSPFAAPRHSGSNTARLGRGKRPPDSVRRVCAQLQDRDTEAEPREPRSNRRPGHRQRPGAELTCERPGASATPGRRHIRFRRPPGGGSLTARISCVAAEPRPRRSTERR